jgi:hypothetical protein
MRGRGSRGRQSRAVPRGTDSSGNNAGRGLFWSKPVCRFMETESTLNAFREMLSQRHQAGRFWQVENTLPRKWIQYPQLSCRTGSRFSASRQNSQLGMKRSIRATKRLLWVGSSRWAISCTIRYSRHSCGFLARSVLSRMLAAPGLQLPHFRFHSLHKEPFHLKTSFIRSPWVGDRRPPDVLAC